MTSSFCFFLNSGLSLENHRSKNVDLFDNFDDAYWIYAMTQKHKNVLLEKYPSLSNSTSTMIPNEDITDPVGENLEVILFLCCELTKKKFPLCQIAQL